MQDLNHLLRPASIVCLARGCPQSVARDDEVVLRFSAGLGGNSPIYTCSFWVMSTVRDVKKLVERTDGTPVREQRLLVNGCQLCSDGIHGIADHRVLGVALQEALGCKAVPGSVVDVAVVRISRAWADLLEEVATGAVGLQSLDDEACSNRELVAAAIQQDARALKFAQPALQSDRSIVLAAVSAQGNALQYASEELRGDPEIVLAALKSNWRAAEYATPDFLGNRDFMLDAVKVNGSVLQYAAACLRQDREVVLTAVERSGWALCCASEELRADRECVRAAVTNNPAALDFAAAPLQSDMEITLLTVGASGRDPHVSAPCGRGPMCVLQ